MCPQLQQILLLILMEVEVKEEEVSLGDKAEVEEEENEEGGIIKRCTVSFVINQAMQLFSAIRDLTKTSMAMHLRIHLLILLNIIRFKAINLLTILKLIPLTP
ncbi:hypothetical protein ACOSQ4_007161 [Xanthoceras sorbifolium]